MHRIDTPTAQKDKFGAGKNGFTAGNPQTGTQATDLDNDYFDMLQEELAGVVEATGVNLDKSKHNQLLTALKALLLSRAHPFADIKADGAAAIAEALSNLGLDRINQIPTETIIKLGPSGNKQFFINNSTWGAWDVDTNKAIPLPVSQGGIGSTTPAGGRSELGLGTSATKDIGTGTGQVPDMSSFVSNKATNGRMELPGGVIRQWGVIQVPGNATTEFSFPVPFPSAAYVVVGSFQVPASGSLNMTPLSRTKFNAQNSYATAQYACWIAEGA
ncbi:RNA polymerase beta [Citrobacter freundii]|nr:RNA polymerase beta [Citrobacter freundii]